MSTIARCLILALLTASGSAGTDTAAERIPEVHSASLSNDAVNLPEELRGRTGILILGFSRGSRDGVAAWGRKLAADYRESATVVYYEMPVLASVPSLLRGMVVRSMRSSVPERAQARFVPVTDNEAVWRALVHYGVPDDPYLLVVDGQGQVVWQTHGQPTDPVYAALKQHVESLQARGAR